MQKYVNKSKFLYISYNFRRDDRDPDDFQFCIMDRLSSMRCKLNTFNSESRASETDVLASDILLNSLMNIIYFCEHNCVLGNI